MKLFKFKLFLLILNLLKFNNNLNLDFQNILGIFEFRNFLYEINKLSIKVYYYFDSQNW